VNNTSFFGGVIYIDLRGYTRLVEEKILSNIANIIYNYQDLIDSKVHDIFNNKQIAAIEYMGDGIMIIIKELDMDNYVNESNKICKEIYEGSKKIKKSLISFFEDQKEEYSGVEKLDFGIGISCSKIFQKYHEKGNRKIFFGTSLNRAAKIGDSMNAKYNHIAIDKKMYDDYLLNTLDKLERNRLKFRDKPLVHMYRID